MDTNPTNIRTRIAHVALIVLGALLAVPVGASLGFYLVCIGGPLIFGPDFFQLGWLFVMFTVPGGATLGAVLGGWTIAKRPRLYPLTFLPLSLFFVGLQITLLTLQGMDRPRSFVLELKGTQGAEFFGIVSADGQAQALKGTLPARLEVKALYVESAFALVNTGQPQSIVVETFADGTDLRTRTPSQTGIQQSLRSCGYSETLGGTSHSWHRMSRAEVAQLIQNNQMPAGPNLY